MIIYQAINKINGKSYVGQTVRSLRVRKNEHKSHAFKLYSNTVFSKALRKYGIDGFEWKVLYRANSLDELNKMEQLYISKENSLATNKTGYNIEVGGKNSETSVETKEKMSKIKKQDRYVRIAKDNLPKNVSGKNNGRYKEINIYNLAKDFESFQYTYEKLKNKYGISRPTVIRKLKIFFGSNFENIKKRREKSLEIYHGRLLS